MAEGQELQLQQFQLQIHDFSSNNITTHDNNLNFTFIPYHLKPNVSKEAVKVHVLHQRKRAARNQRVNNNGSRSNAANVAAVSKAQSQGQMFWWDSRAAADEQSQSQNRDDQNHHAIQRHKAATARRQEWWTVAQRQQQHRAWQPTRPEILLNNHILLHNPLVEQMRDDFGISSDRQLNTTNFLVDHYLGRMGPSKFPRELLACYWQDSASFKAFLAHAAILYSIETGHEPPAQVEDLMGGALREIRQRIGDPHNINVEGTVLAVTMLANIEEIRCQHETAACHWRGLKRLLYVTGGLTTLRRNQNLHTMLFWREMMTSNSTDLCLGHGTEDKSDLQDCNEHIVSFFQNFADRLLEDRKQDVDQNLQDLAALVIQDTAPGFEYASAMRRRSEVACLTYLAMLAINSKSSAESRSILERVNNQVTERRRWGEVNVDEILFVMLQQGNLERGWRCQQLWQLSRCVYLTRTLEIRDWKTVRDVLCLSIGIEEGCGSRKEVAEAWDELSARLLAEDGCQMRDQHLTGWEGVPNSMIR